MRTAVAMSGGVDSTAAAVLLARSGREAVGMTLKFWPCPDGADAFPCPADDTRGLSGFADDPAQPQKLVADPGEVPRRGKILDAELQVFQFGFRSPIGEGSDQDDVRRKLNDLLEVHFHRRADLFLLRRLGRP